MNLIPSVSKCTVQKYWRCLIFFFPFVLCCQTQLMSSLQLSANQISSAGPLPVPSPMANQTSAADHLPLFGGQVAPSNQSVVSSVSQPLPHEHLAQCLPGQNLPSASPMVPSPLNSTSTLDETAAHSVTTHTAPSTVTPSNTATTFSHISEYSSISTQSPPPPSQLQPLASLPATPAQHTQTFALPRPFQSSSANKVNSVQRIAPVNTLPSSHLIFTGLWLLIMVFWLFDFWSGSWNVSLWISHHKIALKPLQFRNIGVFW